MTTYTDNRIPYFYIIKHIPSGKCYAGCKYGKDANPATFMTKYGYKTSSKRVGGVQDLIKKDGLSSFEILTLLTETECGMHVLDYETNYIISNKIVENENWLNMYKNQNIHAFGTEKYYKLMEKKYGYRHSTQNPEVIRKREENSLIKHGVKYLSSTPEMKERVKQTFLDKIGFICNFADPTLRKQYEETYKELHGCYWFEDKNIREKINNTVTIKYGPGTIAGQEVKNKRRKTCLNNLGVENPCQSIEVKLKKETTCMKNFGVKHPGQSEIVKNKIKLANLEKYGVNNWVKTEEGRKLASENMKKIRANMKPKKCPHCGFIGTGGNMTRWHFSNCKMNPTQ